MAQQVTTTPNTHTHTQYAVYQTPYKCNCSSTVQNTRHNECDLLQGFSIADPAIELGERNSLTHPYIFCDDDHDDNSDENNNNLTLTATSNENTEEDNEQNITRYWLGYTFLPPPEIDNNTTSHVEKHYRSMRSSSKVFLAMWYGHKQSDTMYCNLKENKNYMKAKGRAGVSPGAAEYKKK